MADQQTEAGVIQAVMARLEQQTLPRALDIKRLVDTGERLSASDTQFLDEALERLREDGPYVQQHPRWEPLYARLVDLYDQITRKALENEERA